MRKRIKKILAGFLITLVVLGRVVPFAVIAEEIDNTTQVLNEVDSTANTGENSIQEEETEVLLETSPSPEPSPSPELSPSPTPLPDESASLESEVLSSPTPTPGVEIDNNAEVSNTIDSTAITGENTIEALSPSPTPLITSEITSEVEKEGEATEEVQETSLIETGDAVSIVNVENDINSTESQSLVNFHTLNIFIPQGVDIDLSEIPYALAQSVFGQNFEQSEVSVVATSIENYVIVKNDIVSSANTGINTIDGAQNSSISTGNSYSIVSLFNKVNTTIIDSTVHLVTINIFSNVDGNILLPSLPGQKDCCGGNLQMENKAIVENNVNSLAVSGQNSITDVEEAEINTGDAQSVVNLVNVVNKSFVDTVFHYLTINSLGTWTGNFLGWGGVDSSDGEEGLTGDTAIENNASVVNNVSSGANTGGNSISGDGSINTGQAISTVSIFNFVNTSIIRSIGFFGLINIFGSLNGDIGGVSLFAESEPEVANESNQSELGPSVQLSGGQLEVYQENNVGTHVLPGDTVTFFVTVRNPGTGPVYGAKLRIGMINEKHVDMGGVSFDLGDIQPGRGVKVTTGINLAQNAEAGNYTAHAVVTGNVGPDNSQISAYSDSFLKIAGQNLAQIIIEISDEVQAAEPQGEVIGASTLASSQDKIRKILIIFAGLLLLYLPARTYQKRKERNVS